jgi:hypothetical protein
VTRIKNDHIKSDHMKNDHIKIDSIKTNRIESITDQPERICCLAASIAAPRCKKGPLPSSRGSLIHPGRDLAAVFPDLNVLGFSIFSASHHFPIQKFSGLLKWLQQKFQN